jgi:DNA-binding response OmpR family regulator
VRLTEKETGVLRCLCRAGQRPVSRETLLQEVWGYNSGLTTHTLETHIYRLRQKIEKDAASPAILVTQTGRLHVGAITRRVGLAKNLLTSVAGESGPSLQ